MKKAIVIYSSKRGSTKQYAKWIGEDIAAKAADCTCDIVDFAEIKGYNLYEYDLVVYGGWIRGSGIVNFDVFKKKYLTQDLMDKLIVYGVGIANATPENYTQVYQINYKGIVRDGGKNPTMYILSGAYDPKKVTGMDRVLMGVAKTILLSGGKGADAVSDAEEMKDRIINGINLVDRDNIRALVNQSVKMIGQ